eukprot:CAMPEP_0176226268 /NCGR_PEP_ID=MMETSP0121_2-20121125/22176_1 /TAXON_ID=160619 /ORGANISM="Kryptoperidinium foliaceum, Strain CCMP 1326" /LENGTH=251 /DNA_ID=CAMNT_0017565535 /DNA_START=52 /DNA_END=807 /DNA_ORIENTATION=-
MARGGEEDPRLEKELDSSDHAWTALHQAAFEGNVTVCKALLAMGADEEALSRSGQTPADVARFGAKEAFARSGHGETDVAAPPAKKARKAAAKALRSRSMNINFAVVKAYEECTFGEVASAPVSALQGVAGKGQEILERFGVKTVRGLGRWKFYKMAKAITGLSEKEEAGGRREGAVLNADKALDKAHEGKTLMDIKELPPSALQGIAPWADEELAKLHVKTIADLGRWKFAQWSEWIADLAEYEDEGADK